MKISQAPSLRFLLFALASFLLFSCSKNSDTFSSEDQQTSANESAQECTTNELDDIATSVLNSSTVSGSPGGRTGGPLDDRFNCDGTSVVFSNVGTDKTSGTVTITFPPEGCTDKKGNVRKGSIVVSWSGGKWYKTGSSHTVTQDGYSINSVGISGTETVTCTASTENPLSVTWSIAANHRATWPDGTTATRKVNKTRKWDHTATEDMFTLSNGTGSFSAAEGTNRHGRTYKTYITSPLIYLGSCGKSNKVFIPVKGEKVITWIGTNGKSKSMTIDYGSGACDNTYTVTAGTIVKTLTAKNDSSND